MTIESKDRKALRDLGEILQGAISNQEGYQEHRAFVLARPTLNFVNNALARPDPCAELARAVLRLATPETLADDTRDRCTQYAYILAQIAALARAQP